MKAHPERLFVFRLARELGMSVSRVLVEMDSREIAEWMAFFTLEQEEREAKQKPSSQDLSEKFKAVISGTKGAKRLGTQKGRKPTRRN